MSGNTYTVVGTAAQDTQAIDALMFTPISTISATTTFTLSANDEAESATTTPTTALTVTQATLPISASPSSNSISTTDEQPASPFVNILITDPNPNQTETAVVSLNTAANGTLSDPNAAADGGAFSNGSYTVSGSASAVAAALDGLLFTPTAHEATPGMVVSTSVMAAIKDNAGETISIASAVNATAVNDAPTITGTKAGQTTTGNAAVQPFAGVAITDPDVGVQDNPRIMLTGSSQAIGAGAGKPTDANGTLSGTGLTKTSMGTNAITGGSGGDTFVLPKAGQGFDGITGFTEANGDVLNLRAALGATSWNHRAATLGNYLMVTDSGGSATLAGSGNLGLADLLSHHSLLTT